VLLVSKLFVQGIMAGSSSASAGSWMRASSDTLGGSMKRVAAGTSSSSGRRRGVGMNHADSGSSRSRAAEQGNWGKRKRRLQATGEENGSATSLVR
jgi:hypothetical protein